MIQADGDYLSLPHPPRSSSSAAATDKLIF
jgi:hypothetical protein